jgi:hypothetical protein
VAILDIVSRKWLGTVVSAEETSTQVEVAFTAGRCQIFCVSSGYLSERRHCCDHGDERGRAGRAARPAAGAG